MNNDERRHTSVHQLFGTISGFLNVILLIVLITGGFKAFYELQSTVTIVQATLTDLRSTMSNMNKQMEQIDERVRKVEIRTR